MFGDFNFRLDTNQLVQVRLSYSTGIITVSDHHTGNTSFLFTEILPLITLSRVDILIFVLNLCDYSKRLLR